MAANLWESPTEVWRSNLDGRVISSDTQLTVIDSSGLVASGVIVINRQDGQGNNTFDKMEYCSFTGISGNTLTGLSRGLGGYSAKDHNSGALVECFINITHWTDLLDFLQTEHVSDGTLSVLEHAATLQVTGISGISGIKGDVFFVPGSNISIYSVSGASGQSYIKIDYPKIPLWFSLPTTVSTGTSMAQSIVVLRNTTIKSVSAVLKSPTSSASLILDINRNYTSIFTNTNTRLSISASGTYGSTASIGTTTFTRGDLLTLDIDGV